MKKLSKKTETLLNDFDEAAQSYGWHIDMGYGGTVKFAEEQYKEAKEVLVKRLAYLERKCRKVNKIKEAR